MDEGYLVPALDRSSEPGRIMGDPQVPEAQVSRAWSGLERVLGWGRNTQGSPSPDRMSANRSFSDKISTWNLDLGYLTH